VEDSQRLSVGTTPKSEQTESALVTYHYYKECPRHGMILKAMTAAVILQHPESSVYLTLVQILGQMVSLSFTFITLMSCLRPTAREMVYTTKDLK